MKTFVCAAALLLLVFCNSSQPVKEAPRDVAACKTDADCRTYSNYCSDKPCSCDSLPKSEPDPSCSKGKVTCFVDPCMAHVARCQSGACTLASK